MERIYTLYLIVVSLIAALYTIALFRLSRRKKCGARLRRNYIKNISRQLLSPDSRHTIVAHTNAERTALAEAIYSISGLCYGSGRDTLQQIVQANHLKEFIIRRLRRASSTNAAEQLLLLGAISSDSKDQTLLARYLHSIEPLTELCAMLALLNTAPKAFISHLCDTTTELHPFSRACIIAQLRRGAMPIAFEPLLESKHRNLKLLGLAIVRSFELDIAAKHITRLIAQDEEVDTLHEALYTLAALKRPLNSNTIRQRLAQMSVSERKSFCRHLSIEGYSLQTIERLFPHKEASYAEQLISTYKRELIKTNA